MRTLLFLLVLLINSTITYAQLDKNIKAKLYFVEAEKYFNQNDYEQTIEYVDKAEVALGNPNPRTLNLKIRAYYYNGKFKKAESALNLFINEYHEEATESIKTETLEYFVRIENAVEKLKKEEKRIDIQKQKKEKHNKMTNILFNFGKNKKFREEYSGVENLGLSSEGGKLIRDVKHTETGSIYKFKIYWRDVERIYKHYKDNKYIVEIDLEKGYDNSENYRKRVGESYYAKYKRDVYAGWTLNFYDSKSRDDFYDALVYFSNK